MQSIGHLDMVKIMILAIGLAFTGCDDSGFPGVESNTVHWAHHRGLNADVKVLDKEYKRGKTKYLIEAAYVRGQALGIDTVRDWVDAEWLVKAEPPQSGGRVD